jgi:hypothetical protein
MSSVEILMGKNKDLGRERERERERESEKEDAVYW